VWSGPQRLPELDAALLHRLEVRRFGTPQRRYPAGQKVPAGQGYTGREEDEDEGTQKTQMRMSWMRCTRNKVTEDKNKDEKFEDEVEAMLQGAGAEDLAHELPEVSAEGYVVAMYEGLWFLAEVSRDQAR
jgi:hypothetical protein